MQATNDNFALLFNYKAAEFSLAPLPYKEQLRLIGKAIQDDPLNLAKMDMRNYAKVRNMKDSFSQSSSDGGFVWEWHARALKVQGLYRDLVECWIDRNFQDGSTGIESDHLLEEWFDNLAKYIPAFKRAVDPSEKGYDEAFKDWAQGGEGKTSGTLNRETIVNVISTVATWVSWIHEDVGHSAAAYVYNPIHTPMCVPEDGVGIPLISHAFNVAAYRGFVFLERGVLLDTPPSFWFSDDSGDRQCFSSFQDELRRLGETDELFSQCDETGFYSCVDRVETAVSS